MHETRGNHLEPDLYSVRAAVIEDSNGGGDKETARAGGHDGGRDGQRQRADARGTCGQRDASPRHVPPR